MLVRGEGDIEMTIKNKIRKSLEGILVIGSPIIAGGLGLIEGYHNQAIMKKDLGREENFSGQVVYTLRIDGKINAKQYFKTKYGMVGPSVYEITSDNPKYKQLVRGEIKCHQVDLVRKR